MFLSEKYVLANELVEKMDIHIANISMLRKNCEDSDNFGTIVKFNSCSFINKDSSALPNNIRHGIHAHQFTDMSDKVSCNWIRSELGLSDKEMFKTGVVLEKVKVSGKNFFVFDREFIRQTRRKNFYVLDKSEINHCIEHDEIDGHIEISKNKYLVWY